MGKPRPNCPRYSVAAMPAKPRTPARRSILASAADITSWNPNHLVSAESLHIVLPGPIVTPLHLGSPGSPSRDLLQGYFSEDYEPRSPDSPRMEAILGAEVRPEPQPEPVPEPEPEPEPEPFFHEPETETGTEPGSEPEADAAAEPEPEPEPEPAPQPLEPELESNRPKRGDANYDMALRSAMARGGIDGVGGQKVTSDLLLAEAYQNACLMGQPSVQEWMAKKAPDTRPRPCPPSTSPRPPSVGPYGRSTFRGRRPQQPRYEHEVEVEPEQGQPPHSDRAPAATKGTPLTFRERVLEERACEARKAARNDPRNFNLKTTAGQRRLMSARTVRSPWRELKGGIDLKRVRGGCAVTGPNAAYAPQGDVILNQRAGPARALRSF